MKYKDREWLYNQYIVEKKSLRQIRQENGYGINTIKRWMKKHQINTREIDDIIVIDQKTHKLDKHPKWKGKKNNCGYIYIYNPKHPNAPKSGYINEHRFVAEKIIGRVLNIDEFVHHIDMDKVNNDISNLYVSKQRGHKKVHASFNRLCKELIEKGVVYFNFKEGEYGLRS